MKFIAKTLYGLEKVLAGELSEIGASDIVILNRAVSFSGDEIMLYRANYCLRTALSVLVPVAGFRIKSAQELYRKSREIPWDKYMDSGFTFSIVPVIKSSLFSHTGYAGLLLKDAIADWFRERTGSRPSVDVKNPGIVFNLHISNDEVSVSLDSSVVPLYKRGYRREQGTAPLNEVLAAGIVLMSGWDGTTPFYDPMCGSGTILVEAGLIASGICPGRFRGSFGFQKWKTYNPPLFDEVKKESEKKIINQDPFIFGSDVSEEAVQFALENIRSAGLEDIIRVKRENFRDLEPGVDNGVLVMNPPYGERIRVADTGSLYEMIGTTLKHNFPGFKAWLITSDMDSLKHVGLKPASKTTLFNGSLECLLVKYELYPGSRKSSKTRILTYEP
ncbi:MAG TPA: THUMP domain-containing protein [Bacteroidales bacterium]|nr:THUMP domain-containing protein [Bacteroidales bacterium]